MPPIFAIRNENKLCLILNDWDSVLYDFDGQLEAHSISPDNRYITAFVPQPSGSPMFGLVPGAKPFGAGVSAELVLLDRYGKGRKDFGEVRFRRVFDHPQNIIYANFISPVWLPDCMRFYVASRDGVSLAHVDGTVDSILTTKNVSALALMPRSTRCAVSNPKAIFLVDTAANLTETLVDSARAKKELDDPIRALAFSKDGRFLAVGHERQASVVNMSDHQVAEWGTLPHDVYWIGWLPNDTGLVILCGSQDEQTSFRNSVLPSGAREGGFEFRTLMPGDPKSHKLYSQVSYDVRRVGPSLSADAHYVVFASRKNMARGSLMVLPLDGREAFRLTDDYLFRSPAWGAE